MMKAYTELDLLRFIYKEVEICEYFEIDFAVSEDTTLQEDYNALKSTVDSLPAVSYDPAASSIKNIIGYAAA